MYLRIYENQASFSTFNLSR